MNRVKRIAGFAAVTVLALAACGDDTDDESSAVEEESVTSVAATPTVDADDVLLAGLLLTVGDIDRAIAEGLVTPEEVDVAIAALEAGTMSEWLAGGGD